MSVSGEAQSIDRDHLLRFAKKIGLPDAVAKDGIDQALSAANQFASLATSLGAQPQAAKKWAKCCKDIENRLVVPQVPGDATAPSRKSMRTKKVGGPTP